MNDKLCFYVFLHGLQKSGVLIFAFPYKTQISEEEWSAHNNSTKVSHVTKLVT